MTVRRVPKGHYIELNIGNIKDTKQLTEALYVEYTQFAVEDFIDYTYKTLQQCGTVYVANVDDYYSRIVKVDTEDYKQYKYQQQLGAIK